MIQKEGYALTETISENPNSQDWVLTGFVDKKIAVFQTGQSLAVREKERELISCGVFAIVLRNPNKNDVDRLDDYQYGPQYVTWQAPTSTYEERTAARTDITDQEKKKRIGSYRWKIRTTRDYSVTVGKLKEKDYKEWYKIYEEHVVGRKYGLRLMPEDFFKQTEEMDSFYQVLLRDRNSQLVAGLILEVIKEKSILKIRGSASMRSKENSGKHFMLRAQNEVSVLAKKLNLKIMSYGTDPAYYGEAVSIGLANFKSSLGYKPVFAVEDEKIKDFVGATQLIKVVEHESHMLFVFPDRTMGDNLVSVNDPSSP